MKDSKTISAEIISNKNINTTRKSRKFDTIKNSEKNKIRKKRRQTKTKNDNVKEAKKDNLLQQNIIIITNKLNEGQKIIDNNDQSKKKNIKKSKPNLFSNRLKCNYILKYIFDHLREKKI
jgi:hypothetical protein